MRPPIVFILVFFAIGAVANGGYSLFEPPQLLTDVGGRGFVQSIGTPKRNADLRIGGCYDVFLCGLDSTGTSHIRSVSIGDLSFCMGTKISSLLNFTTVTRKEYDSHSFLIRWHHRSH